MRILFMRHGVALNVGQDGVRSDAERPLADEGRTKTREVAFGLRALDVRPTLVLTSPLLRAVQTAEIVAETLNGGAPAACESLAPGGTLDRLIALIRTERPEVALAVGHMPGLADMVSELIAGRPGAAVLFKKSGIASVLFDGAPARGKGVLEWLLQPAQARPLGR